MSRRRSFYELRFSYPPGGTPKDTHWVRGTLAEIDADLREELREGMWLALLCSGATLELDARQEDGECQTLDVFPAMALDIGGRPRVTFDAGGTPHNVDKDLVAQMMRYTHPPTTVTIDWTSLAVPSLGGTIAQPHDLIADGGDWLDDEDEDELSEDELRDAGYAPCGRRDAYEGML